MRTNVAEAAAANEATKAQPPTETRWLSSNNKQPADALRRRNVRASDAATSLAVAAAAAAASRQALVFVCATERATVVTSEHAEAKAKRTDGRALCRGVQSGVRTYGARAYCICSCIVLQAV